MHRLMISPAQKRRREKERGRRDVVEDKVQIGYILLSSYLDLHH